MSSLFFAFLSFISTLTSADIPRQCGIESINPSMLFANDTNRYDFKNRIELDRETKIYISTQRLEESVFLQGDLDLKNTHSKALFYKGFDPLKTIRISNEGHNRVKGIKLINNDIDLYSEKAIIEKVLIGASSEKDSILSVYKFVQDHRIHDYNASIGGNRIGESYNKQRLFTTYGYGLCDASMWNTVYLFQASGRSTQNIGMVHHTMMQAKTASGFAICDADTEGFYLNYDNTTLCDYITAREDRYLIDRVKHFGLAYLQANTKQSWIYEEHPFMKDNEVPFSDITWDGSFDLYPHENLVYSSDVSDLKFQHDYPLKPQKRTIELQGGNATLIYTINSSLNDIDSPIESINIASDPDAPNRFAC